MGIRTLSIVRDGDFCIELTEWFSSVVACSGHTSMRISILFNVFLEIVLLQCLMGWIVGHTKINTRVTQTLPY